MKLIKFTDYFKINKHQHQIDFVNIHVNNGDIPLFLDPYSLSIRNDRWSIEANQMIIAFFQEVIECIKKGQDKQALYMLSHLSEPNQTKLGLSRGETSHGKGVSGIQAEKLFSALSKSKAVQTGLLRHLEECDLFIEGIARDKISDICTNIIKMKLIEYTQEQCKLHSIPLSNCNAGYIWNPANKRWES